MNLRVEVTADDIRRGKRWDCRHCPVARAVKRMRPRQDRASVAVEFDTISFGTWGSDTVWVGTPQRVQSFIRRFDDGKPVTPFTFILKGTPE